ncbi:prepilin peptidase [Vibrio harveyi]|uniref:prepilin peptidase n=1 Tax=Vibrio harveyi TaxID=669 RepID=UPI003CEE2295
MDFLNELYTGLQSMKADLPWMFYAIIFAFAASFATFLNVVIFRLPYIMDREWCEDAEAFLEHKGVKHEQIKRDSLIYSVIGGRSHCTSCKTQIPIYYNVPILGWLLLRGKSACCGSRIPFRYLGFELAYTASALALFWIFPLITAFYLSAFLFIALAITAIDMKTTFIPDSLSYGLLWLGLAASLNNIVVSPSEAIVGVIVSFLALTFVAKFYQLVRGIDGMGGGDFKLLAAISAWTGAIGIPYVLLGACLLTVIFSLFAGVVRKIPGLNNVKGMPFGPGLAIAGFGYVIYSLLI